MGRSQISIFIETWAESELAARRCGNQSWAPSVTEVHSGSLKEQKDFRWSQYKDVWDAPTSSPGNPAGAQSLNPGQAPLYWFILRLSPDGGKDGSWH